jgi:hypothetical protein
MSLRHRSRPRTRRASDFLTGFRGGADTTGPIRPGRRKDVPLRSRIFAFPRQLVTMS